MCFRPSCPPPQKRTLRPERRTSRGGRDPCGGRDHADTSTRGSRAIPGRCARPRSGWMQAVLICALAAKGRSAWVPRPPPGTKQPERRLHPAFFLRLRIFEPSLVVARHDPSSHGVFTRFRLGPPAPPPILCLRWRPSYPMPPSFRAEGNGRVFRGEAGLSECQSGSSAFAFCPLYLACRAANLEPWL